MTKIKGLLLLVITSFFFSASFSQVTLKLTKPLSAQDKKEVDQILQSFNAKSYAINTRTEAGQLKRGLASVKQVNTVRRSRTKPNEKAATNTTINVFKSAKASTNTTINVFKTTGASTNTTINVFKSGNYTDNQLSQLDKLYQILSKYQ